MDFFIKKIFEGKETNDDLVHIQFQKFSKGRFEGKALIKAKNSGGKYSIGTSYEYGNEFVIVLAEKLGERKTKASGIIVSTKDLTGELDFQNKKQFMGIKQYKIDAEMSGDEIKKIVEKFPAAFIALSFNANNTELKINPKSPKSAKPSTKGGNPKSNFCKIKTTDKELVKSLLFDIDINNFKDAKISHTFIIDDIEIPKGEMDPVKMRGLAKRRGKIIRTLIIDGKTIVKEKEFVT